MDSLSWEEKYLRLRTEKDDIAKKSTEQDRAIRQMRTKFAKLESLFKQKQKSDGVSNPVELGDGDGTVGGRRADKDNEQLVTDLYKRNAKLQRDNKALEAKQKNTLQVCAKLKRELQLARRRGGTHTASKQASDPDESIMSGKGNSTLSNSKLAELVEKLRHRLINGEKMLGKLREENGRLRNGKSTQIVDHDDSNMAAARSAKWVSGTAEGEEVSNFLF
ncbi:hypothetical protein ScalyP_jg6288 [Parmales sp. scaly parma]|nr:hypothetical protein ScalyP_jg6288 [Parmales sp. scaly parma]